MNLVELLKGSEGKTLEFKRDLSSPEPALRTIIAFANTAGGTILIGVEDRTRRVRGVSSPLELEERLANLLSDNVIPRIVPEIEILSWRRTQVLAVQVYPSPTRPHYLKRLGPEAGTFVRVGSTNRRADRELVAEMRRFAGGETYDEQPMPDLNSEAVDFRAASESFAEIRKLRKADLETLRLVVPYQGRNVPTIAGTLLFGSDRHRYFPDAWIQAARFRGTNRSRIDDRAEIRSLPVPAITEAIAFVERHSIHGAKITKTRRREKWNLPPLAVREAVINAVTHTDYSQVGAPLRIAIFDDRLEVENPGLLPFGLTIEDLHRGISKLRNRVIGRVFNALGLVEQWGSGVQRMISACQDSGLPPPSFEEIGTRFRVTISTELVRRPLLDDTDRAILDALADDRGHLTSEIARAIGLTPRATRSRLAKLVERGLIHGIGTGPKDPRRRYFRAD